MGNNAYSALKVFYHADRLEKLINGERVAPVYVRLKPTNTCNQNCYYCVYANDKVFSGRKVQRQDYIPWDKMKEILEDFVSMGVKAVTLSGGGDPLCYKYIIETLECLKKNEIDYSVITNAQALKGNVAELLLNAKWIRVSIDAANKDTYKKIRKVDTFEEVVKNISQFAKAKSDECTLGINYVVTEDNYLQVYDICKMAKSWGVDNIKFSPLLVGGDISQYHQRIRADVERQLAKAKEDLETDQYSIIDKYTDDLILQPNFRKEYKICRMSELFTVIGADSKIYFCHQRAYMEEGIVGDISEKSFKEVWFSEEVTKRLREHNVEKECAFRCVFEERNKLLNQVFELDKNHVNFI